MQPASGLLTIGEVGIGHPWLYKSRYNLQVSYKRYKKLCFNRFNLLELNYLGYSIKV
jgi:hypothetical protein